MTYTFKLSRRLAANYTEWLSRRRTSGYTEWLSTAAMAFLLTACGANTGTGPSNNAAPPTPTPGWLTVQLTTPNTNDGAVQLRVTGPSIDSIATDDRYRGVGQANASSADVIITGSIAGGTVARFRVPDVNRAASYDARVIAAAQRSTWALRPSLSDYRAVIVR
jgi:hypothetical protein